MKRMNMHKPQKPLRHFEIEEKKPCRR